MITKVIYMLLSYRIAFRKQLYSCINSFSATTALHVHFRKTHFMQVEKSMPPMFSVLCLCSLFSVPSYTLDELDSVQLAP